VPHSLRSLEAAFNSGNWPIRKKVKLVLSRKRTFTNKVDAEPVDENVFTEGKREAAAMGGNKKKAKRVNLIITSKKALAAGGRRDLPKGAKIINVPRNRSAKGEEGEEGKAADEWNDLFMRLEREKFKEVRINFQEEGDFKPDLSSGAVYGEDVAYGEDYDDGYGETYTDDAYEDILPEVKLETGDIKKEVEDYEDMMEEYGDEAFQDEDEEGEEGDDKEDEDFTVKKVRKGTRGRRGKTSKADGNGILKKPKIKKEKKDDSGGGDSDQKAKKKKGRRLLNEKRETELEETNPDAEMTALNLDDYVVRQAPDWRSNGGKKYRKDMQEKAEGKDDNEEGKDDNEEGKDDNEEGTDNEDSKEGILREDMTSEDGKAEEGEDGKDADMDDSKDDGDATAAQDKEGGVQLKDIDTMYPACKLYGCPFCQFIALKKDWVAHLKRRHDNPEKRRIVFCKVKVCQLPFTSQSAHDEHADAKHNNGECKMCGKKYRSPGELKTHMLSVSLICPEKRFFG
jgi:hypothetical protein